MAVWFNKTASVTCM